MVTSLDFFQTRFYEIFSKLHVLLVIALVGFTWWHVGTRQVTAAPTVSLLLSVICWVVIRVIRNAVLLYRYLPLSPSQNEATVMDFHDAIQICIKVKRPWQFRPGQIVYISIPSFGLKGYFQEHPFLLSWWHRSHGQMKKKSKKARIQEDDTMVLLVKPRSGFTHDLQRLAKTALRENEVRQSFAECVCSTTTAIPVRILLDGPYGKEVNTGAFGTAVTFATGIGIAAQLPYAKKFVDEYPQAISKTRKMTIFWEIESESNIYPHDTILSLTD